MAEHKYINARGMAVLLAVAILIAWGGALQAWFANDDFLWLDQSRLRPVLASFAGAGGVVNDFRPLVRLSFLIDWGLFGDQAIGWHVINLALHLLCAWLFWRLAAQWLGAEIAALAALLLAVSPLLQENLVWISGRSGSLSCIFGLISLLSFERYLRDRRGLWLVVAADLAALACYEPMILLPLFHLGMAAVRDRKNMPWRALGGLLAAHVGLLIYRRLVLGSHVSYGFRPLSVQSMRDVWQDYRPYLRLLRVHAWVLWLGAAALIARRNRDLAWAALLCGAAAVILLLPFVVFHGVASRYFYHAMLPIALLLAILIAAPARLMPRWAGVAFMVLIGAVLLVRETERSQAETADWVSAGQVGQNLVAAIAAAEPHPDPNALHVVLNLPVLVGRGELFFTYPDRAIRRFSRLPFDALWGGHQIVLGSGEGELDYMRKLLGEEDRSRLDAGKPALVCLDAQLAAATSPEAFLHGAGKCGLDVWDVGNGQVQRVSEADFFKWYQENFKK